MFRTIRRLSHVFILALSLTVGCGSAPEGAESSAVDQADLARPKQHTKPAIVLVHGAWADALGWRQVIEPLQSDGYSVTAVENPLTSLAADIETTKRVLDAAGQAGPLVVVGHSFGGAVITEAAAGNASVRALVYVNAFAPDAGETIGGLSQNFAPAPLADALIADTAGFYTIDTAKFRGVFCGDVSQKEANVLAATQKPVFGGALGEVVTHAAWKTIPSYYLVGKSDHAINPDLQRFMAARMGARTLELDSSHVSFVSHPSVVVRLIEQAATNVR